MLPFAAALTGFLETTDRDDAEKNRLSQPNPIPRVGSRLDWAWAIYLGIVNEVAWGQEPDTQAWLQRSRVNITRAIAEHLDDPRLQQAVTTVVSRGGDAMNNLRRLLSDDQ